MRFIGFEVFVGATVNVCEVCDCEISAFDRSIVKLEAETKVIARIAVNKNRLKIFLFILL